LHIAEDDDTAVRLGELGPILWACGGNIRRGDNPTDLFEGGHIPDTRKTNQLQMKVLS
jgi:hypothetical protein